MLGERLIKLTKDIFIYGAGGVLEQALAFFLLPVLSRLFSPADYGVLDTLMSLVNILVLLTLMGLDSATYRFYFDTQDHDERVVALSTSFWFQTALSIGVSLLLAAIAVPVSSLMFRSTAYAGSLRVAVFAVPCFLLIAFVKNTLRLRFVPWQFNILNIFDFLSRFGTILLFVVVLRMGITGNFLGIVIAGMVTIVIGLYLIRGLVRTTLSSAVLRSMLRYGLPLLIASLAYWVLNLADRLFLAHLVSLDQLGLYSIANKFSTAVLICSSAVQLAWAPVVFQHITDELLTKQLIAKGLHYTTLFYTYAAVTISVFAQPLIALMLPKTYLAAAPLVSYLSFGLVFLGMSSIVSTGLTIVKRTVFITIGSSAAAVLNILLNFFLIPRFGALGAAYATGLSYVLMAVLYYFFSQRLYRIPYTLAPTMLILVLGAAVVYGASLVAAITHLHLLVATVAVVAFPILSIASGIVTKSEVSEALRLLRPKRSKISP